MSWRQQRIIGGMFGLEEMSSYNTHTPPFFESGDIFLVNARSGILLLISLLSPPSVWVPSFLCNALLQPIYKSDARINFYEVDYDLVVPSLDWIDNVKSGDLVVFISYFGFPYDWSYAAAVREKGAWVLEDACQALLSRTERQFSDFVLFSPRKFLGVPDGGILAINRGVDFHDIKLQSPPERWWLKALSATILRREFDICGGDRDWFKLFQEIEAECPVGHYSMSELTRLLLICALDYSKIAQQRVSNYQVLAGELSHVVIFPELPSQVVPLGFPIRLKNRDAVRQRLFNHDIYPPIHWMIQGIVPSEFRESHRLAAQIMTLPCDQRYDSEDMHRMAQLILEVLGK